MARAGETAPSRPPSPAAAGGFEFATVPRIVFGRGTAARAAELAAGLGRRALVVSNAGLPDDGGPGAAAARRVAELLAAAGLTCRFLAQPGEPTVQDVDRSAATARAEDCDVLIGLGGGSALDAAKAAAALLTNGGTAIDYMEVVGKGLKVTRPAAPWIAIPTTAGTGAEVTRNAVIACPERRFKASIRGEPLYARAAVVDPELGVGAPPEVTACSGMDALCQLIESYTSRGAGPLTDTLAADGIARAARSLRRAFADGADLDARADMALAALFSGITLANAGLGAVHGFAAPLGANLLAPHGAICAALLPHVMAANVAALRAAPSDAAGPAAGTLARYAAIGRLLAAPAGAGDDETIDAGIRFVADLAADLKIPRLGRFGLDASRVGEMVALARQASSMRFNPAVLPDDCLGDILRRAM